MSSEPPDYAQAQPQWDPQAGLQPQAEPQPQAWPQPQAEPQPQAWPQPQAELQPQAWAQPQYGVQPQPQQWAQPQYQGVPAAVAPRNPVLYLILSFLLPGLGTMVLGNVGKGVGILGLYIAGIVLSIFLIGIPLAIGAWVWGMVDAYQSAQHWNQAHGIIS
jgi:TM2 domain-containing membrane protein YozV